MKKDTWPKKMIAERRKREDIEEDQDKIGSEFIRECRVKSGGKYE